MRYSISVGRVQHWLGGAALVGGSSAGWGAVLGGATVRSLCVLAPYSMLPRLECNHRHQQEQELLMPS